MGEQLSTEQRVRALVVDDESALVRVVAEYLEREGFEVVTQADGVAALALTRGTEPDVVVLDVRMPGMTGIELGQLVRNRDPGLPVVLTSGYSAVIAEQGSNGFELIQKPYTSATLVRAFHKAIAERV